MRRLHLCKHLLCCCGSVGVQHTVSISSRMHSFRNHADRTALLGIVAIWSTLEYLEYIKSFLKGQSNMVSLVLLHHHLKTCNFTSVGYWKPTQSQTTTRQRALEIIYPCSLMLQHTTCIDDTQDLSYAPCRSGAACDHIPHLLSMA